MSLQRLPGFACADAIQMEAGGVFESLRCLVFVPCAPAACSTEVVLDVSPRSQSIKTTGPLGGPLTIS